MFGFCLIKYNVSNTKYGHASLVVYSEFWLTFNVSSLTFSQDFSQNQW